MAGFHREGLVFPHGDASPSIDCRVPLLREEREAREAESNAKGATLARGAGRRPHTEIPDATRTCYEVDRDRILHRSPAFRRLAGKTQVFIFPKDHIRTRLTHALEVTQVAAAIARSLRLNVALTEAIALGHDCGHGPFGHASEDAFAPYLPQGFDHATFGADVVLARLNLTEETTDGIRNHSWSRPAPLTPEGAVVSFADRIAYVCHDFEDAVSAGIIGPSELPHDVVSLAGATRGRQLDYFISDIVTSSATHGMVCASAEAGRVLSAFRQFNYDRIYNREESRAQAKAVIALLREMIDRFLADPSSLPPDTHHEVAASPEPERAVVAYVAGMTDRFAVAEYERVTGRIVSDLPGIDLRSRHR
jgi:dGTPase